MRTVVIAVSAVLCMAGLAAAQNAPSDLPALGDLQREAAELAQVRQLLANPDPSIRLLAMRSIARGNNRLHQRMAIDIGLNSADAEMHEMALRILLSGVRHMRLEFLDRNGQPMPPTAATPIPGTNRFTPAVPNHLDLSITQFDVDAGTIGGTVENSSCNRFQGALPGATLRWNTHGNQCSGMLRYDSSAGEFRGTYTHFRLGTKPVRWQYR